jgi:hypothetical protein
MACPPFQGVQDLPAGLLAASAGLLANPAGLLANPAVLSARRLILVEFVDQATLARDR